MLRLVLICAFAFASCGNPPSEALPPATPPSTPIGLLPNIPLPTFGGIQFWADRRWQEGWRIQQHVFTKEHRLLDPKQIRIAWGTLEACEEVMRQRAPAPPVKDQSLVVLLHGIADSRLSFWRLEDKLHKDGWQVASLSYPSTHQSLQQHADHLSEVIEHLRGYRQVHFVTHSLGGIVLRRFLADAGAWQKTVEVGRIVMIGPPNQGALFAEKVESFPPYRWIFGDAGNSLTPTAMQSLPAPQVPFLVIAGSRGQKNGWNPILPGDDDFVVRVSETHLQGESGHLQVKSVHGFMMNHDGVIAATLEFLNSGKVMDQSSLSEM
ncbi:MAG: alpha/beta fold hydrolase [Planctomycetota bacterium]